MSGPWRHPPRKRPRSSRPPMFNPWFLGGCILFWMLIGIPLFIS